MTPDILDTLVQHNALPDRDGFTAAPLPGGFWNDVFRVRGAGVDWVVKRFRTQPSQTLFPILPESEAAALRLLNGHGIAPSPVAFLEPEAGPPMLVYHFEPGQAWQGEAAEIAPLLKKLHTLPLPATHPFRELPVEPAGLLAQGDRLLASLAPEKSVSIVLASRPSIMRGPVLKRRALVHTDVWPGNLLETPGGPRLIDWQCPGLGDPAEDVWTMLYSGFELLIGQPPLAAGERARFLERYGDPALEARLAWLHPSFAYRLAAYCCLRQQALAGIDAVTSQRYGRILAQQHAVLAR